jgi:enediyne biosynthesis protein E4
VAEPVEPLPADAVDPDLVPVDDAVIGRAFRWSGLVLVLLAAVGFGVWALVRPSARPPPPPAKPLEVARQQEKAVDAPEMRFTDVAAASGIAFQHVTGGYGAKWLPETMGPGGAFFDLEDDGDPDLVLANGTEWPGQTPQRIPGPTPVLYRNDGKGHFEDVTSAFGLLAAFRGNRKHYGMGVAVGDVDGDGDRDLLFTGVGGNRFLRHEGTQFVDATAEAGLAGDPQGWTTGAGFFDADRDGDLDLFVCSYVRWSPEIDKGINYSIDGTNRNFGPPKNYEGSFCSLYQNDGKGAFTDVSKAAGLHVVNPRLKLPVAKALAVAFVDLGDDGFPDVFVANDTTANFLFKNRGDGTFQEVGEAAGVAYDTLGNSTGAMGVDVADFRNSGALAIAVGNFANEATSFYVADRDPWRFTDTTLAEGIAGPSRQALKFGVLFLDVDLDGRLDFFETNGHLDEDIERLQKSQRYRQPSQLFWNVGPEARASYAEVPREKLGDLAKPVVGRGAAYADVDGDGDLDLLVTQCGDVPLLLRNDQSLGHHWLRVRLIGAGGNTDALGARLTLKAGGLTQRRDVWTTRSYLSQVEPTVTFGLGTAAKVDALEVLWPDGKRRTVPVDVVDRVLIVEQD